VCWDEIQNDPTKNLKISPIAMIPHKSRGYRAILDLSYSIRLHERTLASVNETMVKTAPQGSIDQMGHALSRIVHAFAKAEDDSMIFLAKWDIKDGFWHLDCEEGQEWNFAYVLPQQQPSTSTELVIPTSLQMGWIKSPPFFCAASETAWDITAAYIGALIGKLTDNKFIEWTTDSDEFRNLPPQAIDAAGLKYVLEVYMDDYIGLAIPTSQAQLRHAANAVMNGIHDVFPLTPDNNNDPISFKKLQKHNGTWALRKDIL
jgi:hypothetical protein